MFSYNSNVYLFKKKNLKRAIEHKSILSHLTSVELTFRNFGCVRLLIHSMYTRIIIMIMK